MATKSDSSLTIDTDLNQAFPLVKGKFTAEEAQEILMALIESKVAFHSIKNLRAFEQSGEADLKSERRIGELEDMRDKILELIKRAKETHRQLEIESNISISFADESTVESN